MDFWASPSTHFLNQCFLNQCYGCNNPFGRIIDCPGRVIDQLSVERLLPLSKCFRYVILLHAINVGTVFPRVPNRGASQILLDYVCWLFVDVLSYLIVDAFDVFHSPNRFICRGSYGVGKGALESSSSRWRCREAFSIVIYGTWWSDLQKRLVKWTNKKELLHSVREWGT